MPDPKVSPVSIAHDHLVRSLRSMPVADELGSSRQRMAFRLARHLARFNEVGTLVVERDLDDLEALLGTRPSSWAEGEAALERFVLAAGPEHDTALIALFNRRLNRQRMLLGPPGSAMTTHLPLRPLR
jgi:hypothetical protein